MLWIRFTMHAGAKNYIKNECGLIWQLPIESGTPDYSHVMHSR